MQEQLSAVLDELAARFGATGAELWAELVRYEVAGAIMTATTFAVAAIGVTLTAWYLWRLHGKAEGYSDYDVGATITSVVAGFVWMGALIATTDMVRVLSAPQAAVIRGLLP